MDPLYRVARLEEVLELLDQVMMMFTSNQIEELSYSSDPTQEGRRVEFLVNMAKSIGILRNQVDEELKLLSDTEDADRPH